MELLVVIAIIGVLATVILASLNSARAKARDATRKMALKELQSALEMYHADTGTYRPSNGWVSPSQPGLKNALVPKYISDIPYNNGNSNGYYQYWRKDYRSQSCMTSGTADQYAFYAVLENPTVEDLATLTDSFDLCVASVWGMNYKVGN